MLKELKIYDCVDSGKPFMFKDLDGNKILLPLQEIKDFKDFVRKVADSVLMIGDMYSEIYVYIVKTKDKMGIIGYKSKLMPQFDKDQVKGFVENDS